MIERPETRYARSDDVMIPYQVAVGSEVLVSSTVKELVAGSGLAFEDAGEHELKGVPDRWRLYRVANV